MSSDNLEQYGGAVPKGEQFVPVSEIKILDYSPRDISNKKHIDEEHVNEIIEGFETDNQQTPVLINKNNMAIVDGHHRLEAALRLGWKFIRAVVRDLNDEECAFYALKRNIDTKTLTEVEEAKRIKKLVEKYGWTKVKIGKLFRGKSPEWVNFRMKLANLDPAVQEAIEEKDITPSHGIFISEVPVKFQPDFTEVIKAHEMTVTETKDWVLKLKAKDFKMKGTFEDELKADEPSEDEVAIVRSAHDYRDRMAMQSPSLLKTSIINLASFRLFKITKPVASFKLHDLTCKSCRAHVDKCPICRGDKVKKYGPEFVDISFLANKKDVADAIEKDYHSFVKIAKK